MDRSISKNNTQFHLFPISELSILKVVNRHHVNIKMYYLKSITWKNNLLSSTLL